MTLDDNFMAEVKDRLQELGLEQEFAAHVLDILVEEGYYIDAFRLMHAPLEIQLVAAYNVLLLELLLADEPLDGCTCPSCNDEDLFYENLDKIYDDKGR